MPVNCCRIRRTTRLHHAKTSFVFLVLVSRAHTNCSSFRDVVMNFEAERCVCVCELWMQAFIQLSIYWWESTFTWHGKFAVRVRSIDDVNCKRIRCDIMHLRLLCASSDVTVDVYGDFERFSVIFVLHALVSVSAASAVVQSLTFTKLIVV